MTEVGFSRRKIVTPAELRVLSQKSDLRGFLQLGSHFGAVVVAGYLHALALGSYWVLITGFLLGVLINFLYAGQHELSHSTVFKTRWLNEFFGRIIGFIQLFPRDFDQVMHFAHHQWTQDWERDGELIREPYTLKSYLLWLIGVTYWRNRIFGMIRRARGIIIEPFIRKEEEGKIIIESRLHLLGYLVVVLVSIYLQSWVVLTFWIIPLFIARPVHQLQNTIEHLGLSHENDILENTRSTRTNALFRWLCWQMPYHTAHHAFPGVPFWKLKKLNEKMEQNVPYVHRMGWIEFQIEVIRKLATKGENDYPMNEVWIVPNHNGRDYKFPAEG